MKLLLQHQRSNLCLPLESSSGSSLSTSWFFYPLGICLNNWPTCTETSNILHNVHCWRIQTIFLSDKVKLKRQNPKLPREQKWSKRWWLSCWLSNFQLKVNIPKHLCILTNYTTVFPRTDHIVINIPFIFKDESEKVNELSI